MRHTIHASRALSWPGHHATQRPQGLLLSTLVILSLALAAPVSAQTDAESDAPGQGELHVIGAGPDVVVPLEHTRVEARIDGDIARVTVTQRFANPFEDTIEAIYIFPLPDNAAVDDMVMRVGDRTIRGVIERREEARRIYEAARDAGHVASLLDQERPNIFTQSVANILPGNSIEVTIRYVETVPLSAGRYSFVFPMVVGPRFIPGASIVADPDLIAGPPETVAGSDGRQGTGWSPDTDRVPDASRITPPVLEPGERSGHDIALGLSIRGGAPVRDLDSPSHAIDVLRPGKDMIDVQLQPFDTIPNRDFVLRYRLAGEAPELAVLPHRNQAGDGYFSALLVPAAQPAPADVMPKEIIFVVDCSGSMQGEPMAKAKAAMRHALKHLDARDSFQIIRFSTRASGFRPQPVPATPDNIRDGLRYVEQMSGGGGTQMIEGIKAALDYRTGADRLRIVSFMTDGYIGNETEILAAIQDRLGGARLFSFGVGSSVNRYLLDRMAEAGRGEVEYVLLGSDTREVVERFYDRIRSPYLTDIEIEWGGLEVAELYPARPRDLFLGQTLRIAGRYAKPGVGTVTVRGRLGGRPWQRAYRVELPAATAGGEAIASLWARARVRELESQQYHGRKPEIVEQITRLALDHRLMTAYTSFVAVEERVEVVGGKPRTVTVPVEMPEGVSYEGVFGASGGMAPQACRTLGYAPAHVGSHKKGVFATFSADRVMEAGTPAPASLQVSPGASSIAGLAVELTADRGRHANGEQVVLTLVIANRSGAPIELPARLAAGPGAVELSIIDDRWNTIEFIEGGTLPPGAPSRVAATTQTLAPGARLTVTIELPIGAGNSVEIPTGYVLPGAGTYHVGVLRIGGHDVHTAPIRVRVTG